MAMNTDTIEDEALERQRDGRYIQHWRRNGRRRFNIRLAVHMVGTVPGSQLSPPRLSCTLLHLFYRNDKILKTFACLVVFRCNGDVESSSMVPHTEVVESLHQQCGEDTTAHKLDRRE